MMNIKTATIIILFLSALAVETTAQGSRIMLTQLERAPSIDGSRRGMIGLSNANGDQRYAFYVNVADTCINYTPADTGNAVVSIFVQKCATDSIWYIDFEGRSILLAPYGAGSDTCDTDFLQISDNSCPDALTDSLYKYRYLSVGARYVFPGAELLVNDSSSSGIAVVQGFRNARLALVDGNAGNFLMIDHGSNAPVFYLPVNANLTFKTTAGTPQTPLGSQVNHFAINAQDSTIQMNQYPRTRVDTQAVMNFLYTDPVGKVRSRDVAYLTDTLGFGANIYNSDGSILAGVTRTVGVDSTAEIEFTYPSGSAAFRVSGGEDSTAENGSVLVRGPGDNHGRIFVSSEYVSFIKNNSDSQSYIEFGPDDPGIYIVLEDQVAEQGYVLMSNEDGFFNFATLDTFSRLVNIYNNNGIIENETPRTVTVDTLSSLSFSTPLDGTDLTLLQIFAGDGTGANSNVYISAGTDGSFNRILVEDGVGIEMYWQDDQRVYISDIGEQNYIWQNANEFHAEGNTDTTFYQIIAENTNPNIYLGVVKSTTTTDLDMDAATGEESFMLRSSGDNGDLQAFVSGVLAASGVTAQTVVAAYDVSAPQFSLNEIRIDTAGVGINTRGGVGNDGDVLHSNGEKAYWAAPEQIETIYNTDATFDGPRTATLDAGEFLSISYSSAQPAIWAIDAASTSLYSPSGSNTISVGDGQVLVDCQQSPQGIFTIQSDVTNIQATGGYVRIGGSGGYSPIAITDSSLTYETVIYAGTQTDNAKIVLPVDAPANGNILRMKTASEGITEWGPGIKDGILSADQLSWTGGGNEWTTVNANRALFVQASGTLTPSIGVTEIIVNDTATTSTVNLNYVPGDIDGASYAQPYTTVRYIYNWGSGDCTVDTNQDWGFRIQGDGTPNATLTIPTGQSYKLVWVQGNTEADSAFWCFRIQ